MFTKEKIEKIYEEQAELKTENKQLFIANLELSVNADYLQAELDRVSTMYNELSSKTDAVTANAEKHMQLLSQNKREMVQMQDTLAVAKEQVSRYKVLGTPKKIKEQISEYKKKCASQTSTIKLLKKNNTKHIKDLQRAAEKIIQLELANKHNSLSTAYSSNGEHLVVFPSHLTMLVNGVEEKQIALLYLHDMGVGLLLGLSEDNEVVYCEESLINPSDEILDKAGILLRKFKRQGWKLLPSDLDIEELVAK